MSARLPRITVPDDATTFAGARMPSFESISVMDVAHRDDCERGSRLLLEAIHRLLSKEVRDEINA